jgi:hypothetical protein
MSSAELASADAYVGRLLPGLRGPGSGGWETLVS